MNETISVHDLQPGDVLLHKGTAFISRAIQFFDGTDMSHASLYLGNQQVGEAIAEGLVQRDLTTSLHGNEWVKAFRLKDTPADMAPVLQTAEEYLEQGNRYGYEQLLLTRISVPDAQAKVDAYAPPAGQDSARRGLQPCSRASSVTIENP